MVAIKIQKVQVKLVQRLVSYVACLPIDRQLFNFVSLDNNLTYGMCLLRSNKCPLFARNSTVVPFSRVPCWVLPKKTPIKNHNNMQ